MRRLRRPELRVESFEYVEVGPGLALLRLAGEWRHGTPPGVRLMAVRGDSSEDLAALPDPPPDGTGLWRAAFSVDGELLDGWTRFVLERDGAPHIELPEPVEHGVGVAEPEPEPVAAPEPVAEPEPELETPAAADDASALEALETERRRHERVEAGLREQLRVMVSETAEFMGRLEGYELRRAELEKELSWERLLHRETRRHLAQAERDADDAQHRAVDMRRRVEERDELLAMVRESVEDGSGRLGDLEERLVELREAGAEVEGEVDAGSNGHSPSLSARQAAVLDRVRGEAEAGVERLQWVEERVVELRAAILSAAAAEQVHRDPPRRRRRFLR